MYYTDVKLRPKKAESHYLVSSAQLPPMISSVASKLGLYKQSFHGGECIRENLSIYF